MAKPGRTCRRQVPGMIRRPSIAATRSRNSYKATADHEMDP